MASPATCPLTDYRYSGDEPVYYESFGETARGGVRIGGTLGKVIGGIGGVLKPLDPTNKNSELRKLFRDVDRLVLMPVVGIAEQISVSPYLAAYLQSLEAQLNDGRAKTLPDWLKRLIYSKYPEVNLDHVRYGENIKTLTVDPTTAVTIGYSIYFPSSLNLDPKKIIRTTEDGWYLARDHIVQFLKAGGDRSAWAIKYLGSIVVNAQVNIEAWHDAILLERQADAKADSLLNYVLQNYARGHPTYPFSVAAHGSNKSHSDLHIFQDKTTLPGWINGHFLLSPNEQYKFMIQGDGNLVFYGPNNAVVWQAHSYGKACPPFALGASDDRTSMTLYGLTFEPRGKDLPFTWTSIWNSPPVALETSGGNTGGFYLVDPGTIAAASLGMWLELTDYGQLVLYRGRINDDPRNRKIIWTKPDANGITTTIIEPTEGTLPAAVPRARSASATFIDYQPPLAPQFYGSGQFM